MLATAHTRPAATDAPNEDSYIVLDDMIIVLDGATIRTETGCIHGLPWYVRNLGLQLTAAASDHAVSLTDAISAAISAVSAMHSDTCDLSHPGTPSAAIGMVRQRGNALDYAVLGDITVVIEAAGRPTIAVVDERVSAVAVAERRECDRHLIGTPEKQDAILTMKGLELAGRNTEGGYWIASTDPAAAGHALTGTLSSDEVVRVAACSDGAMRALDMTSVTTTDGVLSVLRHMGPAALVDMVRRSEDADPLGARWPRNKTHDDATAVIVEFHESPQRTAPSAEQRRDAVKQLVEMTSRPLMGASW